MTSFLLLATLTLFSYIILRQFSGNILISNGEMLAAAIPLGFAIFAAITSILGIYLPTSLAAGITSLTITVAAIYSFFSLRKSNISIWPIIQTPSKDKLFFTSIFLFFSGIIIFLVYNSFIIMPNGSISVSGGASVDAPYHLAQITRFGYASRLDFEEPNFSGEFIRYPYFINLISGILFKFTNSLKYSFHLPIFFLIFSGVFLLISFCRQLGLNKLSTALTLLISLFAGGLGYLGYYWMNGNMPLPIRNGMIWPAQNISYPGMIPGFLIVQRPFFLGLPLFLLALLCFLNGIKNNNRAAFILAGIIAGLLPFSHMHSFLSLGIFTGTALIYLLFISKPLFYNAFRGFIFTASFLAIPQLAALLLLPQYPIGQLIKFRLGWMGEEIGGIVLPHAGAGEFFPRIMHIWTNFGFLLLLPAVALFYFIKNIKNKNRNIILDIIIIGGLALWIIPYFIQFQVWDFDTNKFFAYAIILSAAAYGSIIESLTYIRKKIGLMIFSIIMLLSIPSSLISTWRIIKTGHFINSNSNRIILFTDEERATANWLRNNVHENTVLLSSAAIVDRKTIQNPIAVAAGLKSSAGFMTWLYTHGIDFSERVALIEDFLADPGANPEFFKKVPADYLIIDSFLREKYPKLEKLLMERGFKKVYRGKTIAMVSLKL